MRRVSCKLLKQGLSGYIRGGSGKHFDGFFVAGSRLIGSSFCSTTAVGGGGGGSGSGGGGIIMRRGKEGDGGGGDGERISYAEAKRLMRLVNVESLKVKLGMENKEVIGYKELLEACESMGVAKSVAEAADFAKVLDEAGIVLLFRDKVYLHPDKVVDLVRKAVPLALLPENDPSNEELKKLQEKKEELDKIAHKQVRRILWTGLGLSLAHVGLFFRLTFWEFSWDVMEPIAFFATATGIVVGYAYFLFTSRDPTYQDFMKRLFLSRQRKLIKKYNFDIQKFEELQRKCKSPLDVPAAVKHRIQAAGVDSDDLLH